MMTQKQEMDYLFTMAQSELNPEQLHSFLCRVYGVMQSRATKSTNEVIRKQIIDIMNDAEGVY